MIHHIFLLVETTHNETDLSSHPSWSELLGEVEHTAGGDSFARPSLALPNGLEYISHLSFRLAADSPFLPLYDSIIIKTRSSPIALFHSDFAQSGF